MDCKLEIKLRHLFHWSGFHFGQHHEDFDNRKQSDGQNLNSYVWVMTQKALFVSNAVVPQSFHTQIQKIHT